MSAVAPAFERLAAEMDRGETTSAQLTEACLSRIRVRNPGLRAFLHVDEDAARDAARAADARRAEGRRLGPLDGFPVALKDNLVTRGMPTTCGSRMLADYRSPVDATVVTRLRDAGAVLIGKTNLDEFGMGSSTEHSAFGPSVHPLDPGRVPGGSSGGSCVAVADGMVPLALGSDTGGSVRLPAAWCGVVGLKPTWGRVSRSGLVAFASSLDQVGTVASSVAGVRALFTAVAGPDPADATSRAAPPLPQPAEGGRLDGLRVGVVREWLGDGVDGDVRARLEEAEGVLESLGAHPVEVRMPHARYAVAAYYVLASAEASSNLARFDGVRYGHRAADPADLDDLYTRTRSEGFGPEVKRRILMGTFALAAGYHDRFHGRASKVRAHLAGDYARAFAAADVLLSPVAPCGPFPFGAREDPLAMYLTDAMTVPASLAGIPALSVPCGSDTQGLPVGMQLQAPAFREDLLFRAAAAFERAREGRA